MEHSSCCFKNPDCALECGGDPDASEDCAQESKRENERIAVFMSLRWWHAGQDGGVEQGMAPAGHCQPASTHRHLCVLPHDFCDRRTVHFIELPLPVCHASIAAVQMPFSLSVCVCHTVCAEQS